ncbi:hypothetical protein E2C01_020433 [Portunus trituberculatus]|uniref:Uncharacterized protein n=1 Tax=Portunus trituberculatus TaxID=210409 RepID=A0A5B7E1G9_PORTR|nr:hypothetical protein [Portunus trituberculatus]
MLRGGTQGGVVGGRDQERDARVCKAKPPKLRGRVTWKLGGRVGGVGSQRDKWFLMTEALPSRPVPPFFSPLAFLFTSQRLKSAGAHHNGQSAPRPVNAPPRPNDNKQRRRHNECCQAVRSMTPSHKHFLKPRLGTANEDFCIIPKILACLCIIH